MEILGSERAAAGPARIEALVRIHWSSRQDARRDRGAHHRRPRLWPECDSPSQRHFGERRPCQDLQSWEKVLKCPSISAVECLRR